MIKFAEAENFEVLNGLYEFHGKNVLSGPNGSGKTAIGRLIFWVFTGRDILGSQGTDWMIKDEAAFMRGKVILDSGTMIERRQLRSGTKTIKVNGETVSQDGLAQMLPVDWEVFASSFLVGYFMRLDEIQKRDLVMRVTPHYELSELFKQMTPAEVWETPIDWSRPTKELYETWNKKKIQVSKEVDSANGALEQTLKVISSMTVPETVIVEQVEKLGQKLTQKWSEYKDGKNQELEWVKWKLAFDSHESRKKHRDDAIRIRNENQAKREALKARLVPVQPDEKYLAEIDELDAQVSLATEKETRIRKEIESLDAQYSNIGNMDDFEKNCPKCKQSLPEKTLKTLTEERQKKIETANDLNKRTEEKKAELKLAFNEIADLRKQVEAKVMSDRNRVKQLDSQNEKIRVEMSSISDVMIPEVGELAPEPKRPGIDLLDLASQLKEEEDKLNELKMKKSSYDKYLKESSFWSLEADKQRLKLKDLIRTQALATTISDALHPKTGVNAKAIELKMDHFSIPGIEFKLEKTQKNGEVVGCFQVWSNGVIYEALSDGQQIKTAMKIADRIDEITGRKVAMRFIDNVDLMDKVEVPEHCQVFMCEVRRNQADLRVEKV